MKDEKEKIDLLLDENTTEQLSDFDWEQLNNAISQRLSRTVQSKVPAIQIRLFFRIAACFAVATAVVVCAMLMKTQPPTIQQNGNTPAAVVTFPAKRGSAKVQILDTNGQESRETEQSSWILIRRRPPLVADYRLSRDEMDFTCIF